MGPKPTVPSSGDLYRSRLDQILDQRHELFRLAALIDWDGFNQAFGRFYRPLGRPAKPTRVMVGLSYLQHTFNLSDEAVVQRWIENPYWQWFCGCASFQHVLPCDPSSLTRWRKRLGPEGLEKLLAETIQVGLESGTVQPSSLERISVDTTVQPKAITHPTDAKLYLQGPAGSGAPSQAAWPRAASGPHPSGQTGGRAGGPLCPCAADAAHAARARRL